MHKKDWEIFYLQRPHGFWDIPNQVLIDIRATTGTSISVMDVGCGQGILLHRMAQLGFHRLYGVDFSIEAVNRSRRRVPNAVIDQLDIETEEINWYDLIFCHLVLPFMQDKDMVFKKLLQSTNRFILSSPIVASAFIQHAKGNLKALPQLQLEDIFARNSVDVKLLYSRRESDFYRTDIFEIISNSSKV
jgi:2-polyprenyl-3-methyl-5-hydroxy-6-metoxy-1,4-benzoquinol methylase